MVAEGMWRVKSPQREREVKRDGKLDPCVFSQPRRIMYTHGGVNEI